MKYIIEIEDEPFGRDDDMEHYLYRAKGFKSLVFDQEGLAKLVEFDHMCPSWYEEVYQKGLDDAWDAARRIGSYADSNTWKDIGFRLDTFGWAERYKEVIANYTASEAIAKLKEYEQRQAVEVGDEVFIEKIDQNVIVLNTGRFMNCMDKDGVVLRAEREDVVKTGRHFPEIAEVLKKMQEGQDGVDK